MNFLCDVHIPLKLVNYLKELNCQTIHVNHILNGSQTTDSDICRFADSNDFIVITKDSDFKDSFLLKRTPRKLIKFNLGNIPNNELIDIITKYFSLIEKLNSEKTFIIEFYRNMATYQI